jgi:hypothetical protein
MAYWLDGFLIRKAFDVRPGENYPDGGCNSVNMDLENIF